MLTNHPWFEQYISNVTGSSVVMKKDVEQVYSVQYPPQFVYYFGTQTIQRC
jgi:hypothetical protein